MKVRLGSYFRRTSRSIILISTVLFLFDSCANKNPVSDSNPIPAVPILNSPQNASTITASNPTFEWEYVSAAIQYRIQISADSTFSSNNLDEYVNSNNYTATKNLGDGTYYWRVAAKNSGGLWGKASPAWHFTIVTHGPSSPVLISPVSDITVFDNQPTFEWSPVNNASQYNLEVSSTEAFDEIVIDVDTYNSNYAVSSPLANNSYYWRVRTKGNEGLWGDYSSPESFEVRYAWAVKTSMPTGRYYLSSAVVGDKIYCIGGSDGSRTVSNNEVYDPQTDSWKTEAPMPTARAGLGIVAVNDKIYAIGGYNDSSKYLGVNEMYDPMTDTWKEKKEMPQGRSSFATAVLNGKIYVIGGTYDQTQINHHTTEIYDPVSDSWEYATSDVSSFFVWWGESSEPVATVLGGKIYIVSGDVGGETIEYDPANNVWMQKSPMPIGSRIDLAACAYNNKLYSFGGGFDTQHESANYSYDPDLDLWTKKRDMPTPRNGLTVAVVGDSLYTIGGNDSKHNSTNEEYTPEFDK